MFLEGTPGLLKCFGTLQMCDRYLLNLQEKQICGDKCSVYLQCIFLRLSNY